MTQTTQPVAPLADASEQLEANDGLSGPGVICFCGQDWWYHNRAHSDFQLMICVSRHRRVLLVNSIGMRMPLPGRSTKTFRRIWRKLKSMLKFVRRPKPEYPNLFVLTPISIPVFRMPGLRTINAWAVRVQVAVIARVLKIRDPMICVTLPTAWEVVEPMRRSCLIYNRSDKHSAFQEADQAHIRELELTLMREADHVIYVSRELMEGEASLCGGRAYFLDHGVDESWFSRREEPEDLRVVPRPRIGFFGGLRARLVDFDLLARIADEVPDCQLVLIGDAQSDLSDLTARPNVHWLGFRDHDEIPAYGAAFDVALMPYHVNDWIQHCNPIKLKEYLALGLPVVSTDFPEARRHGRHVAVACDGDQFVEILRALLADSSAHDEVVRREERRASVQDASWDQKAIELLLLTKPTTGA